MRPVRRIVTVLALTACLAAMVGLVPFETVDAGGTTRARSAGFVWQTVPAVLSRNAGTTIVPLVLVASLAVTVVGCFVLVWLAGAVESDDGDDEVKSEATRSFDNLRRLLGRERRLNSLSAGLCIAAAAVLAGYAAWCMGLFAPLRAFGVADTFASFDHPFHVARAETLLRSILDGRSLRWVASHQGGYPAEFYPFLASRGSTSACGCSPRAACRCRSCIVSPWCCCFAPGVVFYVMGRRDGWPAMVPLTAFALQVAVPGEMWSGGYSELVLVGLVANVAAALASVVAMVAAADAFANGRRPSIAVAACASAAAIWCNPRSAIGLVVCVGAAWVVAGWRDGWRRPTLRLLAIAGVSALLAAPELVPLIRFRSLYFFIRYTSYGSVIDYLVASIDAVSVPGFLFAIAGVVAAAVVLLPRHSVDEDGRRRSRPDVVTTLVFSFGATSLIEQLEATRLMPVQRLLSLYAAAVGCTSSAPSPPHDGVYPHRRPVRCRRRQSGHCSSRISGPIG